MWRLNCGCGEAPQPFETEITVSTYHSPNITFNMPFCNTEKDCLKDKIIQDFLDIIDRLECGIQPDLENIIEEISLIEMKKDWNLGIVREKKSCNYLTVYSGWADTVENINIENGIKIDVKNNSFTTAEGEGLFVWLAIPSNLSIDSVENTRFYGDFIQNNLIQIENQSIYNTDYKVYYYEFLGLPSDNRYNVILKQN